ncbi:MAG: hypothetical protein ACK5MJ_03565 [Alphaproteobacteria bacterium]
MTTNITEQKKNERDRKFQKEADRLKANLRKRTEQQKKRNLDRSAIKKKSS